MPATLTQGPVLAPNAEVPAIRDLAKAFHTAFPQKPHLVGPNGETLEIPASVYTVLVRLVDEMARSNAVVLVPVHAELTTQQAADLLDVSRPFFVKLLESGEIPFHMVGSHRRVKFEDLVRYGEQRSRKRRAVLGDLAREAQDLGIYE